jgi:putative ABC transport system substrate-binding protein
MRRRALVAALAVAGARRAAAQPAPARLPRVAILTSGSTETRPLFTAFRDSLQALGWIEGRNVAVGFHLAGGSPERLTALAQAIARDGAEVVLADGGNAAAAIFAATRTIPIVAVGGIDPSLQSFAASLARPGGNLTGITTFAVEMAGKQIEVLHELAPAARRIGAIRPADLQRDSNVEAAAAAAATSLGLTLRYIHVATPTDVARELASAKLAEFDAMMVVSSPVVAAMSAIVVERINASRKPAVYLERDYIDAGGLVVYGIDYFAVFRRLAVYVDRVLRGANPAEMPIERPDRIELIVNLKVARALGIAIPPTLLGRADEVIE